MRRGKSVYTVQCDTVRSAARYNLPLLPSFRLHLQETDASTFEPKRRYCSDDPAIWNTNSGELSRVLFAFPFSLLGRLIRHASDLGVRAATRRKLEEGWKRRRTNLRLGKRQFDRSSRRNCRSIFPAREALRVEVRAHDRLSEASARSRAASISPEAWKVAVSSEFVA